MFKQTQKSSFRNLIKMGNRPYFAVEQPQYVKHAPGNNWFNAVHDGVSEGFQAGYTARKMNPVRRFWWNINESAGGASSFYLRNPGGKCPHWLSITGWGKFTAHVFSGEAQMHVLLASYVTAIVIWNLSRYLFFHPDLTIYNIAYFTVRRYLNVLRNNEVRPLDAPVFRWMQQAPEIYNYNPHRDMIEMGVLANDPQVEYMKAIGKEDLLVKHRGEPGWNTAINYLPKHQWGWSWKAQGPENPCAAPEKH